MCPGNHHLREAAGNRLQIFLNGTEECNDLPKNIDDWINTIGKFVAIKDLLSVSFALAYTHEKGDPNLPKSAVSKLRLLAKPYENEATNGHLRAAKKLAKKCVDFLGEVTCYSQVDCIVAVPPSDPEKAYSLPKILAAEISRARGIEDLSGLVSTVAKRKSIKSIALQKKLGALRGTVSVDPDAFESKTVLLVDDLYQSGTTINYCAQLLLDAGALCVMGLACEKTCRNDDNV